MNLGQDWGYINHVADQRRENNRTPWHVDKDYLEIIGAAGELAARRFLGLPEKLHTHFDGGKDLFYRGYSIDIKTTVLTPSIEYRYLQWPYGKPIWSNIIFMWAVDINQRNAFPIGWAFSWELTEAVVNTERIRPCHEIPVRDLRQPWELTTLQNQNQHALKTAVYSNAH